MVVGPGQPANRNHHRAARREHFFIQCAGTNAMVMTRSMAEKFFPNEDPINKTVIIQFAGATRTEWVITGVAEDPLPNSSLVQPRTFAEKVEMA